MSYVSIPHLNKHIFRPVTVISVDDLNQYHSIPTLYMAGSKIESKSFAPQSCCYLPLVRVDTHLLWRTTNLQLSYDNRAPSSVVNESAVPAQGQESIGRKWGVQSIVVACFSISPVWEVFKLIQIVKCLCIYVLLVLPWQSILCWFILFFVILTVSTFLSRSVQHEATCSKWNLLILSQIWP